MRKLMGTTLSVLLLMPIAIRPSIADEHENRHEPGHGQVERWHGDIRHFHENDFARWRGGRWFHGPHNGRAGWWWIVGGAWYFYPAPVYPYPDPFLPPVAVVEAPPGPPGAQYWYYCPDPPGYYPYVPACRTEWQPVTPTAYPGPPPG